MNPTIKKELAALLLLLAATIIFYASQIPMVYIACYIVVLIMFIIFILGVVRHKDLDERDREHRVLAADSGFIAAGVVLLIAIAYQTVSTHMVDPWLFITLIAMLATRLVVRIHLNSKN